MKILAFTDVHADKNAILKIKDKAVRYKPDFLVCCGDLSLFGKGLEEGARFLDSLGIKTLMIPGNHETPEEIKDICSKNKNIINIHQGAYDYEDYILFGWGTGGFSFVEDKFERIAKQFIKTYDKNKKLIFITHAPIYGTNLDLLSMGHRGCKSTRDFIEEVQPVLVLCGHFHENFKKQDKIKKTLIVNPGDDGMFLELK